jgi:hypothetical protein
MWPFFHCKPMTLEIFLPQFGLLITTGLGIFFVGRPESSRFHRWGYLLALLGQVVWLYLSRDICKDWGMFILTVFCTVGWAEGVWLRFVKRGKTKREDPDSVTLAGQRSDANAPAMNFTSASAQGSVHRKLEAVDP